ncbi:phage tail assembly chaperone [Brevibacillus parabrevis]|uniref:phage tail assembly chaperone n=1 Tax=Brevibacillus parabrevis TaxID=54914 RepID=UPI003D19AD99
MQIKHKDVQIGERTFRIKKFPAKTGSFVLIKVTKILAPLFAGFKPNLNAKSPEDFKFDDFDFTSAIEQLSSISEQDFNYLQEQALKVCYEVLPAGLAPVLNENGMFGVENLEDDTATVMALMVHALGFNVTSFFQGSGLTGVVMSLVSNRQG